MGSINDANAKVDSFVATILKSPLFHAALPLAAAIVVASEHRWPSIRDNIAGGLLLLSNLGRIVAAIGAFVTKPQGDEQKPQQ